MRRRAAKSPCSSAAVSSFSMFKTSSSRPSSRLASRRASFQLVRVGDVSGTRSVPEDRVGGRFADAVSSVAPINSFPMSSAQFFVPRRHTQPSLAILADTRRYRQQREGYSCFRRPELNPSHQHRRQEIPQTRKNTCPPYFQGPAYQRKSGKALIARARRSVLVAQAFERFVRETCGFSPHLDTSRVLRPGDSLSQHPVPGQIISHER